ncbi:hypothetical protein [Alienimonas sp. DA493]|uniref:hypothetical protein n=1 Tax=Alienimonas sp. DA493 TaxID=3373605 RepID=UPI003754EBFD
MSKGKDVRLEYLPADAPELNAVEALARESVAAAGDQRLLRGFVRGTQPPFPFGLPTRRDQPATQ